MQIYIYNNFKNDLPEEMVHCLGWCQYNDPRLVKNPVILTDLSCQ